MGYWRANSDLGFIVRFRADVAELYQQEGRAEKQLHERGVFLSSHEWKDAIKAAANDPKGYQSVPTILDRRIEPLVRTPHKWLPTVAGPSRSLRRT